MNLIYYIVWKHAKGRKDVGAMICCEWCNQWYHYSCVNLTKRKANKIEEYRCAKCLLSIK